MVQSCSEVKTLGIDQLRKIRPLKPAKGRILPDLGVSEKKLGGITQYTDIGQKTKRRENNGVVMAEGKHTTPLQRSSLNFWDD